MGFETAIFVSFTRRFYYVFKKGPVLSFWLLLVFAGRCQHGACHLGEFEVDLSIGCIRESHLMSVS